MIGEVFSEAVVSEVAIGGFATSAFFGSLLDVAFVATAADELSETV